MAREDSHDEPVDEIPPVVTTHQPPSSPPAPAEPMLAPEPTPEYSYEAPISQSIPVSVPVTFPEELNAELMAKYEAAQAEIQRLRATIESMAASPPDELRRRNRALSDDGASIAETDVVTVIEDGHYNHQEGVPLQLVVIIALGVFITTYLFF